MVVSSDALCSTCLNPAGNDEQLCSVCKETEERLAKYRKLSNNPDTIIEELRTNYRSAHSQFDVCIGISGGVDSCMVATLAGEAGLRAKLVHFDNGWNSAAANYNIRKICKKYDFVLDTKIMDWKTFRSLQRSFILASVPDIELVTDHAIFATMTNELSSGVAPYFLSGGNFTTEHGLDLGDLVWNKLDSLNISAINRKFENYDLAKYPSTNPLQWAKFRFLSKKAKIIFPLNWYWYQREQAISYMKAQFGFIDYGFKHEESVFTKVYQRTILRQKFSCEKIRPHLNAQIRNQEISRSEGQKRLSKFLGNSDLEDYEVEYVRDKLGFSAHEWDKILAENPRQHSEFLNFGQIMKPVMLILSKLKMRSMT